MFPATATIAKLAGTAIVGATGYKIMNHPSNSEEFDEDNYRYEYLEKMYESHRK